MSQAEALLNSLSDEQVSTYASPASTSYNDYFVIGDDRIIVVPDNQKKLGVQYDDNVNTVTFKCGRYQDGRDLSLMKLYINYELPNGTIDGFIAENVTVFPNDVNYIYFDWTITGNITQYKGNLKFLVCARRTDDNGVQINHWNSELCTECYISEGLEVKQITTKQYNDITTKLLTMLNSVEDTLESYTGRQLDIMHTEVDMIKTNLLASIPEDYTAMEESTDRANRTRASAVINTVEDDVIALTDGSNSPFYNLRILGKTEPTNTTGSNLLSKARTYTFVNNAGSQKVGLAVPIEQTGKYTYYVSDSVTAYIGYSDSLEARATHKVSALKGCPAKGAMELQRTNYFLIWFDSNVTPTDAGKYFLGLGENLDYEPYTGAKPGPTPDYPITIDNVGNTGKIEVEVHNRNLFTSEVTTYETNGVTIKQNPDGSFNVNGTATALFIPKVANILLKANRTYILSGGSEQAQVTVRDSGASMQFATSYGSPTTFSVSNDVSASVYIRVEADVNVENVVLHPMIQLADFEDRIFEKSEKQTASINLQYGLPGIEELGVYDEIDLTRGVHIHRIGRASLIDYTDYLSMSDNSIYSDSVARFDFAYCLGTKKSDPLFCNRFINKFAHGDNTPAVRNSECISTHSVNDLVSVFINKSRLTSPTVAGFITWLESNETIIQYCLATPYETELTPAEIAAYRTLMTRYPNTTIYNSVSANMIVEYNADTKSFILKNGGGSSVDTYNKTEIDQMFAALVNGNEVAW